MTLPPFRTLFLHLVGLLCARNAQTMLLPFRSNPQNVQARVRDECFGRGCAVCAAGHSAVAVSAAVPEVPAAGWFHEWVARNCSLLRAFSKKLYQGWLMRPNGPSHRILR